MYIRTNIKYHLLNTFHNPKDNNGFLLIHKPIALLNQRFAAAPSLDVRPRVLGLN